MLDAIHQYFHAAADVVGLDSRLREIILAPRQVDLTSWPMPVE